jgi:periplasmic protein CpxP/Spy
MLLSKLQILKNIFINMEVKMKSSIFIIVVTTLFLFGFNSYLHAQRPGSMKKQFMKELNLTDKQEERIDAIRYKEEKAALEMRNEVEKNRLEIRHMMTTNNIDAALLESLTKKNSEVQANLKQLLVKNWLDIYNILDDNQKEIWADKFDEFGHQGRGKMNRGKYDDGDFGRPGMEQRMNPRGMRRNF